MDQSKALSIMNHKPPGKLSTFKSSQSEDKKPTVQKSPPDISTMGSGHESDPYFWKAKHSRAS